MKKIAVIGAGISGLTCAYELHKAGFDVTIFEKEADAGGRMRTRITDGFHFDIGADHLIPLYTEMMKYCEELNIGWEKMRFLEYGILQEGRVKKMLETLDWAGKLRLAAFTKKLEEDTDFFDWNTAAKYDDGDAYTFFKKKMGQKAADYLADGMTSTYQFHRSHEMSKGAMMAYMQSIKFHQPAWHLHRTDKGMSALPQAMAEKLNMHYSTAVTSVQRSDGKYEVTTASGVETFDQVVMATIAPVTAKIVQDLEQEQRWYLEKVEYATSISIAYKIAKDRLPQQAVIWHPYAASEKISGFVNEAYKGEDCIQGDTSYFSVWLHEDYAKSLIEKTDEEIFENVKQEFINVSPWLDNLDGVENLDLHRWPAAMPKFNHGHLEATKTFLEHEQGKHHLYFTGDYLNAPWTEGALRRGQEVAKLIIQAS